MTKLSVDDREIDVPPEDERSNPTHHSGQTCQLDELLDKFEKMTPEERRRDIERANAFFRENGIDTLAKFDEWVRK